MSKRLILDVDELIPVIQEYLTNKILRRDIAIVHILFEEDTASIDFSWSDDPKPPKNGVEPKEKSKTACPVCGKQYELLRLHLTRKHPDIHFTNEELADLAES